jgi:hypothetical protein
MFDDLNYITLYWLSGFAEPKYEVWESKKISITRSPDSLNFRAYLAWPLEEADEVQITIRRTDTGLAFLTDWFPEEEFDLHPFGSQDGGGTMLMSKFLRETFFIHLRQQYE